MVGKRYMLDVIMISDDYGDMGLLCGEVQTECVYAPVTDRLTV